MKCYNESIGDDCMKNEENNKSINRGFFKNLKATYKYAGKGKRYIFMLLFFSIILTIISIAIPIFTAKRIVMLTSNLWHKLFLIILVIFFTEILRNIVNYLCTMFYNKLYYNIRKKLQLELVNETLKITQSELNSNSSGVFIERINNDTDNIADIFWNLFDYITAIIGNIGILISVIFINVYVGLAYILFLIIIFIYNKYSSKINYENRKVWKKSREKTGGFISEIVRGAKDIKILNAEKSFLKKADMYMDETNKESYAYQNKKSSLRLVGGTIRDLLDLGISLLLYFLVTTGAITVEYIIIILNYHSQITWTADWIEQIFDISKQYNLAANRIFGILEENEFEKEKFGKQKLTNFKGNIEFKNVKFSYEDKKEVLKGLNLNIKANQTVGFVGPSGAGKSTIFNLISALNKPNSGTIEFDGVDINNLDKDSIRGNLSVISQNAYIYNMSIIDNLKVVKMDATESEIKEACKLACLDDFINSLPEKYNTIVGEGGVTLSGGQKQRLAIARALLLKTKILLFDEATSALDNETQNKIQQAINNLKGDYTILIIAHRLSTVIDSNKIFVIDDGKVEAEGNHEFLLKNSNVYKKLYKKESEIKEEM